MKMDIQARGFRLSEALRTHAERRLRFALGSTSARVTRVAVRLEDENGPRGGLDKRCTIRVLAGLRAPLVVEHAEADLYVAIDRAADRAGRALARRLGRQPADRRDGLRSGWRVPEPDSA